MYSHPCAHGCVYASGVHKSFLPCLTDNFFELNPQRVHERHNVMCLAQPKPWACFAHVQQTANSELERKRNPTV